MKTYRVKREAVIKIKEKKERNKETKTQHTTPVVTQYVENCDLGWC